MAANEITFKVKVEKDGSLKMVAGQADKAAKSTDKLSKSTDTINKKRTQYQKIEKGVGQAGLSSAKGFSKQAGAITGGLVPAYAVLAANVFAITAAFNALKQAAQVETLEAGFTTLGNTVGRTATIMADRLKEVTGNAISTEQALRAAASGFSAGFSISEMEGLTEIARGASIALGRDLGDALDRLIRGTAKLEPEILDELGLFVRLDDAVEKYATELGRTASSLTEAERRQAFLNEALEQGERKFGNLAEADVNPFDRMAGTFRDLAESFLQIINVAVVPFLSILANNVVALTGVMILFGTSVLKAMVPALTEFGVRQKEAAQAARDAIPDLRAAQKAAVDAEQAAIGAAKVKIGKDTIFAQLQGRIAAGKGSPKDIEKSIKSLNASVVRRQKIAKDTGKTINSEYVKETKAIEALILRLKQLQNLRAGSGQRAAQEALLGGIVSAEESLGETLENINTKGAVGGFKEALAGMMAYKASILSANEESKKFDKSGGIIDKFGKKAKTGFTLASAGVRLFGAALINAIPIIGQIIFFGSLLLQFLVGLFKRSDEVTTPLNRLDKVLEGIPEKVEQLNVELKKSQARLAAASTELERSAEKGAALEAQIKVLNGIVIESEDAFQQFAGAIQLEELSNLDRILRTIGNAFEELGSKIANFLGLPSVADFFKSIFAGIGDIVDDAGEAVSKGLDAMGFTSEQALKIQEIEEKATELFTNVSQSAQDMVIPFENIEAIFGASTIEGFLANAKELPKDFKATSKETEEFEIRSAQLQLALEGARKKMKQLEIRTVGLGNAFKDSGQKVSKAFTSIAKPSNFQEISQQLKDLKKSINNTLNDPTLGQTVVDSQMKQMGGAFKKFGVTVEEVGKNGANAFNELEKAVNDVIKAEIGAKHAADMLKEVMKQIKIEDQTRKAARNADQLLQSYMKTGKFQITAAQAFENAKKDEERALQIAEAEATIKKQVIELENMLILKKIDLALLGVKAGSIEEENLLEQKRIIESMMLIKKQTIDMELKASKAAIKTTRIQAQESARAALISGTSTGTTQQRIENFSDLQNLNTRSLLKREDFTTKGVFDQEGFDRAGRVADIQDMRARVEGLKGVLGPTIEELKKLGPEGEVVAAVTAGSFAITDAFMNVAKVFEETENGFKRSAAIFGAISATIGAISQVMNAASNARVAAIDREIAAEQKRDGKSKESLAKINALERKKEAQKKKAFEQNKKLQMAQIIANTAMGISAAMAGAATSAAGTGFAAFATLPLFSKIMVGLVAASGAAALAMLAGTSYSGGGNISATPTGGSPGSISVGQRRSSVDLAKSQSAGGELRYLRGNRGTGGPENFRPAFYGKKNRAMGGATGYVVGEQGPELFMPDRPGTIMPADDTAAMTGGSNVTFNINAIDASGVEDVLTEQQGNIIGMLRQAANSYGQEFFEDVDETIYAAPQARRA
ncbi:MAG: hypothetical protein CL997_05745 [Euryarchaeota archaeon]|nr:hypothetical protein [Euryarchaeota archaeon]